MSAHDSSQWFWSDWAGDRAVRRLSPAERGLWIDLLSYAAVGSPTGYVCDDRGNPVSYEEIARFSNCTPTDVESLIAGILEKGAASRDRTGRLFNRRMVRHAQRRAEKANAGKLGGDQTRKIWSALKASALERQASSTAARAPATTDARAPRTAPFHSSKIISSTVSVERERLGKEVSRPVAELSRSDLDAIYARKGVGTDA